MRVEKSAAKEKCLHKGCQEILNYEINSKGYIQKWICPKCHYRHPEPTVKNKTNCKPFHVNHRLSKSHRVNGVAVYRRIFCDICSGKE